jgi:hypothetical protein
MEEPDRLRREVHRFPAWNGICADFGGGNLGGWFGEGFGEGRVLLIGEESEESETPKLKE